MTQKSRAPTLDVRHALLQDLLQRLGVLQLLLHLGDDALGELPLLALLDLALVPHPRVQHALGLGRQRRPLLELVRLGLELGGFLDATVSFLPQHLLAVASRIGLLVTLDTSNRVLVTSTTPDICLTSSMRVWTAWVWSARAELRMFLIFSFCPSAHSRYMGPPNLMSAVHTLSRQKATTVSSFMT